MSTESTTPDAYFLAIDIERAGPQFKHGIMAVGVCFGRTDGTVIEQRAFCGHVPPSNEFDAVCWEEFWVNHQPILDRIMSETVADPIGDLHKWLQTLELRYGPFGRKHKDKCHLRLVSDNPAYDIGLINLEFFKKGYERPLAEMFDDYVPTDDPTEQMRHIPLEQQRRIETFLKTPHDHWPVNDATRDFEHRCAIELVTNEPEGPRYKVPHGH